MIGYAVNIQSLSALLAAIVTFAIGCVGAAARSAPARLQPVRGLLLHRSAPGTSPRSCARRCECGVGLLRRRWSRRWRIPIASHALLPRLPRPTTPAPRAARPIAALDGGARRRLPRRHRLRHRASRKHGCTTRWSSPSPLAAYVFGGLYAVDARPLPALPRDPRRASRRRACCTCSSAASPPSPRALLDLLPASACRSRARQRPHHHLHVLHLADAVPLPPARPQRAARQHGGAADLRADPGRHLRPAGGVDPGRPAGACSSSTRWSRRSSS